ncbi:MAG: triosephosphate isomerase, partial [Clostridia bacterium]|nr:triosephosphate isomerase [Clostridia bacterium]
GMTPILCYGESLEERKSEKTKDVVLYQLDAALSGLTKADVEKIIFAYEPIWAIGTGVSATDDEAEEICKLSKDIVREKFSCEVVVLYGGSMKPANAKGLLSKPSIDGGLIGGACLKTEDFKGIINN